jgi:DNA polymerase, archaea type
MWILDSAYRNGGIDLWTKDDGVVTRVHHPYDPPFLVHFSDPHASHELIGALEERYGAEECTICTVFGKLPGYHVFADRRVAEAIEEQAQYDVQLFNVDVRRDQRFMAERSLFPCSGTGGERFSPAVPHDLDVITIRIHGEPERSASLPEIDLIHRSTGHFSGPEKTILSDLFDTFSAIDPDVILMPDADAWMPRLRQLAQKYSLAMPFARNGKYRTMDSLSYWSYGRMEHKDAALVPDGRMLIDTERSFVYREGGLEGILLSARLSGLSPNLASRFTPGTLISSYETYEAVRQGIAVPFRKSDGETIRRISALQAADRGGMMFQPRPGIFENVEEIDFTSMYPSIIVKSNLSPETIIDPDRRGFLPEILDPLLRLRIMTKQMKKTDPAIEGIDSILKWMLVTCFGYTGYKNAKFGRIEVHEGITARSREILIRTKDIAEEMGFTILHGIVDCLWVQGSGVDALKTRVEQETGLTLESEHFDWIVFEPLADGFGAYNRYFGRLPDGSVKVRGIAARRHDTPEFVRSMQREMLSAMSRAGTVAELGSAWESVRTIYRDAVARLASALVKELVISRRISRMNYAHRCLEAAAVRAYRQQGASIAPGMMIRYVVTDARRYQAEPAWSAVSFDQQYYRGLLDNAWGEIEFAFREVRKTAGERRSIEQFLTVTE